MLNISMTMHQEFESLDHWYARGIKFFESKCFSEAIQCFDRSLELSCFKHFNSWYMKGTSLYYLGKFKQAIQCFDQSLLKQY